MEPPRDLAPCLIGEGTITEPRDMIRALETLEGLRYTYTVDGVVMAEGTAALVKLMADDESATLLVNGCLFLNTESFRYLTFSRPEEEGGEWVFELHGDGSLLRLVPEDSVEPRTEERAAAARMMENGGFDPASFARLDDEDDELD